jgi:hypothetical protein
MANNSNPSFVTAASNASMFEFDGAAAGLEVGNTVDPAVAVASDM